MLDCVCCCCCCHRLLPSTCDCNPPTDLLLHCTAQLLKCTGTAAPAGLLLLLLRVSQQHTTTPLLCFAVSTAAPAWLLLQVRQAAQQCTTAPLLLLCCLKCCSCYVSLMLWKDSSNSSLTNTGPMPMALQLPVPHGHYCHGNCCRGKCLHCTPSCSLAYVCGCQQHPGHQPGQSHPHKSHWP
jgi:hypothetical protein